MTGTPIHNLWRRIKNRCFNSNDHSYKKYGGRGITMCDAWRDNYWAFYHYVINLPDYGVPGYTLDRKENDGNYEPDNVRWASRHVQMINQRINVRNKSGYTGVHFCKFTNRWKVQFMRNYKHIYSKKFKTKKEAVDARNQYIIDNNLPHKIQEWKG